MQPGWTLAGALCVLAVMSPSTAGQPPSQSVAEKSITELRAAMDRRQTTSRTIVQAYLDRIARYDPALRAVITLNPRALSDADVLDRERERGRVRGPLHGIPIALKDNIQTTNIRTTGGALAFAHFVPPYEATLAANLQHAGAIIIAKTSMTELANWIAGDMPNNYNAVSGQGVNPYGPSLDPGGSSSGIGTAANFWAANVGTETSGSILTPSSDTMLVGIKPTVGRVSRHGVIPIAADQDTPGPMAKFVADAAILLGAMEGARPDPRDAATTRCTPPPRNDYTPFLNRQRIRGARIGVPRAYYYERFTSAGRRLIDDAVAVLVAAGAVIVDPADIPSVLEERPDRNVVRWSICSGPDNPKGRDHRCSVVFKYGMKRDFNRWLESLGQRAPVKTLADLRQWNRVHEAQGALRYGQAKLDVSDEMDVAADRGRYEADRKKDLDLSATHGIDEAARLHRLDALLFGGSSGAVIAARAGYPSISVPFGPPDRPFGITFTGVSCSEPALIGIAYGFEQATKRRVPPPMYP